MPYYNETDGYYYGIRKDIELLSAYVIDLVSNDGDYMISGVYGMRKAKLIFLNIDEGVNEQKA